MNTENLKKVLTEESMYVDSVIHSELDFLRSKVFRELFRAMEYSIFPGGKRIRPILLKWSAELGEPDYDYINKAITAIEFIHTYSLIHDDLPAMDDDDLRRGKASSHKEFGEGMAILAGDALLTEAFHLLSQTGIPELIKELSFNSGPEGMVGGQAADIKGFEDADYVNDLKTACLFRAAAVMGGIIGGLDNDCISNLSKYGMSLGRAFQLRDDLLDLESENIDEVMANAEELIKKAKESVSKIKNNEKLIAIADFVIARGH